MRTIVTAVATLVVAVLALGRPGPDAGSVQDSKPALPDPLKLPGYKAYVRHCAPCHGERGDGKGVATRFLEPSPRDFKQEPFRLVSTGNGAPSPKDLFETIATGVGGTAMIPFGWLGEDVVWQIVEVVEGFRLQGIEMRLAAAGIGAAEIAAEIEKRRPMPMASEDAETPETLDSAARGLVHYRALCASCHGIDGRGVMPTTVPAGVTPVRPRDFGRGVLKQIPTLRNLFDRVRCGMPGTTMPGTPRSTLSSEQAWELVHYLRTLIPQGAQLLASADPARIPAARLEGPVPDSPDDPRFLAAPRTWIAFAPFRDTEPTPPGAFVQALAAERMIAFRFTVPDATIDVPSPESDLPPDGIAVRITSAAQPPVLPFPGQPVRLDRALFVTGPLPEGRSAIYSSLPRFDNPEGVCRMVVPPDRAGAGFHRAGAWHVALAVRTDESGSALGPTPLSVSFAPFDGALRRGPMPVAFSTWHRLVVK
jgi:mono/diheme cytochrome c family protein